MDNNNLGISLNLPPIKIQDFDTFFEAFIGEVKKITESGNENAEKYAKALEAAKAELISTRKDFNFPDSFSVNEANDIIAVLQEILSEAKKEKLGEFKNIVKSLNSISKQIPVMPDLPMEDGRIKVILPDYQVGAQVKTETGRKLKQVTGQFVGGATINPNITLKDSLGNIVNPASEGTLQSIAGFNIPRYNSVAVAYPTAETESYTFSYLGTTVGIITVTYTDASKAALDSVVLS